MAASIKTADFQATVLDSKVPVVVDFYATWCGPCRMQGPILDEMGKNSGGAFEVVKVDVDNEPDLAVKYGITALPTLIVFDGGEPVEKFVGLTSKDVLSRALKSTAS
jgi:thioredoxin 1